MQDLRRHPFRIVTTKIAQTSVNIFTGPGTLDHPLLDDTFKGVRGI
jgi:hypothetical protein